MSRRLRYEQILLRLQEVASLLDEDWARNNDYPSAYYYRDVTRLMSDMKTTILEEEGK